MGNKIALIKEIRTYTNLGLKEAKDVADAIQAAYTEDTWSQGDVLQIVSKNTCQHCHTVLWSDILGALFCSAECFEAHSSAVRRQNARKVRDQQIANVKEQIAGLQNRLYDLQREADEADANGNEPF